MLIAWHGCISFDVLINCLLVKVLNFNRHFVNLEWLRLYTVETTFNKVY